MDKGRKTKDEAESIRPTPHAPRPTFHLYIDRLILRGFPPGDRARIGEAVESSLAQLLAEQELPLALAPGSDLSRLNGGAFTVAPEAGPEVIGRQIAQAIYQGLRG